MLIMKSKKPQYEGRNRTTNLKKSEYSKKRKLTNTWQYWKQKPSNKRRLNKKLKRIPQENEKTTRNKIYLRNLIKGINNWAVHLVRYSGPFLKWTGKYFNK